MLAEMPVAPPAFRQAGMRFETADRLVNREDIKRFAAKQFPYLKAKNGDDEIARGVAVTRCTSIQARA
jgi:hypothetical protein